MTKTSKSQHFLRNLDLATANRSLTSDKENSIDMLKNGLGQLVE